MGTGGARNGEREGFVKTLRMLSRKYNTVRVAVNASRFQVARMADALTDYASVSSADREAAEAAATGYRDTWGAGVEWPDTTDVPATCETNEHASGSQGSGSAASLSPTNGVEAQAVAKRVWKFQAAQLTYNSKHGDWSSRSLDVLKALFDRLVAFAIAFGRVLGAVGQSVTLEESTRAEESHVHAHIYFHLAREFHRQGAGALSPFVFEGIHPHVEVNKARGKSYVGAVRHGHFYVFVNKIGSHFSWSDYPPFESYAVEGWWLDNLLKHEKLTRDDYLGLAARVGVGFSRRFADARCAERFLREQSANLAASKEAERLHDTLAPVKTFTEVEQFVRMFSSAPRHRRPILVIVGGTNLGKSLLAGAVLRRIGLALGVAEYLEVTVEDNPNLDFSDFDHRKHAGVLLDGVADTMILKHNREALQGRPKLCKGGQSATMIYSYNYTLCNRAVVATFDLSASNLEALTDDHWLSESKNIITLRLAEKAFVEPPPQALPMPSFHSGTPSIPMSAGSDSSQTVSPLKRRWISHSSSTECPQ